MYGIVAGKFALLNDIISMLQHGKHDIVKSSKDISNNKAIISERVIVTSFVAS